MQKQSRLSAIKAEDLEDRKISKISRKHRINYLLLFQDYWLSLENYHAVKIKRKFLTASVTARRN